MTNYTPESEKRVKDVAYSRGVTTDTVKDWVNVYNAFMQRAIPVENPIEPYIVDLAAEHCDPNDPHQVVKASSRTLYRIAVTYWARAAGAHVPDVLREFDSTPQWAAEDIAKKYPVVLPLDSDGMIDGTALMNAPFESNLQRAIMFDLQANIAEASTWGGDDNWFDYLPNGILQLQSIQDEGWARIWADVWNTHPYGNKEYYSDDISEEEQDRLDNIEERLAEQYGFYIQDVTSGFIYALMRKNHA